jgi:hypothetical protein
LGGRPLFNAGSATNPLPFNTVASFTTSSIVIGLVVLLVMVKLVRSMGWRRALHRLRPLTSDADTTSDGGDAQRPELEELGMQLAFVTVADPGTEPDPRRAVIGCYLQMLEVAAVRQGFAPAFATARRPAVSQLARASSTLAA